MVGVVKCRREGLREEASGIRVPLIQVVTGPHLEE